LMLFHHSKENCQCCRQGCQRQRMSRHRYIPRCFLVLRSVKKSMYSKLKLCTLNLLNNCTPDTASRSTHLIPTIIKESKYNTCNETDSNNSSMIVVESQLQEAAASSNTRNILLRTQGIDRRVATRRRRMKGSRYYSVWLSNNNNNNSFIRHSLYLAYINK